MRGNDPDVTARETLATRGNGSFWQRRRSIWQRCAPHHLGMTNASISDTRDRIHDPRWRSVGTDLAFWTVVGAVVAALSGPLGEMWGVPRADLVAGGLLFLAGGALLLFGMNRIRPLSRGLVLGCGVSNLLLASTASAAAALGWLPLTSAGNWALAGAGDVALVLGVWQLASARRAR
jgi:hypothetical protein